MKIRLEVIRDREVTSLEVRPHCCGGPGELRPGALGEDYVGEVDGEARSELPTEGSGHELAPPSRLVRLPLDVTHEDEVAAGRDAEVSDEELEVVHRDSPVRHRLHRLRRRPECWMSL